MYRLEWVNRAWIVTKRYEGDAEAIEEGVKSGYPVLLLRDLDKLPELGISKTDLFRNSRLKE